LREGVFHSKGASLAGISTPTLTMQRRRRRETSLSIALGPIALAYSRTHRVTGSSRRPRARRPCLQSRHPAGYRPTLRARLRRLRRPQRRRGSEATATVGAAHRGLRAALRAPGRGRGSRCQDRNCNRGGSTIRRVDGAIAALASVAWRRASDLAREPRAPRALRSGWGAEPSGDRSDAPVGWPRTPNGPAWSRGVGGRVLRGESGRRRAGVRRVTCPGSGGPASMGGSARRRGPRAPRGCGGG